MNRLLLSLILILAQSTVLTKTTVLKKSTMIAGGVAIPTVTIIGTINSAFASPYSIALTAAVPAGSVVALVVGNNSDTAQTLAVSDSKGNCASAYTQEIDQGSAGNSTSVFYSDCLTTTPLTTSDHITLTPVTDGGWTGYVIAITGNAPSAPLDGAPVGNFTNNNTTATTPSFTPTTPSDIAISFFCSGGVFSAYGNIIGTAATGLGNTAGSGSRIGILEWRSLSASTTGTATATLTALSGTTGILLGYKS